MTSFFIHFQILDGKSAVASNAGSREIQRYLRKRLLEATGAS